MSSRLHNGKAFAGENVCFTRCRYILRKQKPAVLGDFPTLCAGVDGNGKALTAICPLIDKGIAAIFRRKDFIVPVCIEGGIFFSECNQLAHQLQQGILPVFLTFHTLLAAVIDRQIQFCIAVGKTAIFAVVPLHRRAATGTGIAAVFVDAKEVVHSNFVAVVNKGNMLEGEQKCKDDLHH